MQRDMYFGLINWYKCWKRCSDKKKYAILVQIQDFLSRKSEDESLEESFHELIHMQEFIILLSPRLEVWMYRFIVKNSLTVKLPNKEINSSLKWSSAHEVNFLSRRVKANSVLLNSNAGPVFTIHTDWTFQRPRL